jgi:hypothetical protein
VRLLLIVGSVLSPLRAVAATIPMLVAYDASVRSTATTVLAGHEAVRTEAADAERPALNDYDAARLVYEGPSNPHVFGGTGAVHAYDDALEHARTVEHADRREVAIFAAPAATTAAEGVETAAAGKLPWGFFSDYPKVVQNGTEYAQIGERLFTEHAVERMLPVGMGGRGIAPGIVEDAIATGAQSTQVVNGVTRTIFTSGNVQVVTEQGGSLVVTVMRIGGQ